MSHQQKRSAISTPQRVIPNVVQFVQKYCDSPEDRMAALLGAVEMCAVDISCSNPESLVRGYVKKLLSLNAYQDLRTRTGLECVYQLLPETGNPLQTRVSEDILPEIFKFLPLNEVIQL
eukprot:345741_1